MISLSISEIIRKIKNEETFEAEASDKSFTIKINRYLPYLCTAIHEGSNLRKSLKSLINVDDFERWYEEDPNTADFISSMPITLIGNDTRFEYDLNRSPQDCIYEEAWGKKVWKKPLHDKELKISLKKHSNYYKVTHALVQKIEEKFGGCIVYDIHSYNYKRWDRNVPIFNIGTENIDSNRYSNVIENWRNELTNITIPHNSHEAKINDVFMGRGYNLNYITSHFKNTLVLATEVAKIYCDELTGENYPQIIKSIQRQMKIAILNNVNYFCSSLPHLNFKSDANLLDEKIDTNLISIDKKLYQLLKNFELLAYVNPINSSAEKKQFFKNKFTINPKFKYKPVKIDVYKLKQELFKLKVENIKDISIQNLYQSVIDSYVDKIELLASLGTPKFMYNSLRYFGRPSTKDLRNAEYLLLLPEIENAPKKEPFLPIQKVVEKFESTLKSYGFEGKIEITDSIIAQVMVLNYKKTILINANAKFTQKEINYLAEHEIGVHMVTSINSTLQKLRIFDLGLPVNTKTQEGLAVLSEYLSGNLTMKRLKKIALRVIAVDLMCSGYDFKDTFNYLVSKYKIEEDSAYDIVTRIYRGGGFTKDYLYLSGFVQLLRFWENNNDLEPLLVGKTSLKFYNTISELIDRNMVSKPKYITQSFVKPQGDKNDRTFSYVLRGLK